MSKRSTKQWFNGLAATLSAAAILSNGSLEASLLSCLDSCSFPKIDLYADFLYWEFAPEGIEYVKAGYLGGALLAPGLQMQQGLEYIPQGHLFSGFRVGGIAHFDDCCNWDLFAQYTWNHPILKDKIAIPLFVFIPGAVPVSTLTPTIQSSGNPTRIDYADCHWSTTFNVVDVGIGHTIEACECFTLRPHFGIKSTWQTIKYDVNYSFDFVGLGYRNAIHSETDLWAVGPRGGFDAAWLLNDCFSLVGNVAVSAMYASFDTKRLDQFHQVSPAVDGVVTNQRYDVCATLPVLELFLGLRYDICSMYVMLGWEHQVWFNYTRNIVESLDQQGPQGNLVIQGATLRGGVGF